MLLPQATGSWSISVCFISLICDQPQNFLIFVTSSNLMTQMIQNFNYPAAHCFSVICIIQLWVNMTIQHSLGFEVTPLLSTRIIFYSWFLFIAVGRQNAHFRGAWASDKEATQERSVSLSLSGLLSARNTSHSRRRPYTCLFLTPVCADRASRGSRWGVPADAG